MFFGSLFFKDADNWPSENLSRIRLDPLAADKL